MRIINTSLLAAAFAVNIATALRIAQINDVHVNLNYELGDYC